MSKEIKTVAICLGHKWEEGMSERILKVYPNVTEVKISGFHCVACNKKV